MFCIYICIFIIFNIFETVKIHSFFIILLIFLDSFIFFIVYLEFLKNLITHILQLRTQILTRILGSILIFAKVFVWHLYHHVTYTCSCHLSVKMAFLVSITSAGMMNEIQTWQQALLPLSFFFFFDEVILEWQLFWSVGNA